MNNKQIVIFCTVTFFLFQCDKDSNPLLPVNKTNNILTEKVNPSTSIIGHWIWLYSINPWFVSSDNSYEYTAFIFASDKNLQIYANDTLECVSLYDVEYIDSTEIHSQGKISSDCTGNFYFTISQDTLEVNYAFVDGPVLYFKRFYRCAMND